MKEIETKDMPEISGGWVPLDGPTFPPGTESPEKEFPPNPMGPLINDPTCPDPGL